MPVLGIAGERALQERFLQALQVESPAYEHFDGTSMLTRPDEVAKSEQSWLRLPSDQFVAVSLPPVVGDELLEMFHKRPSFALIHLVRGDATGQAADLAHTLALTERALCTIVFDTADGLDGRLRLLLKSMALEEKTWFRPDWDAYFMEMAKLASLRSNCCKRRVGCVLVDSVSRTVLATGYNGTPRGLRNCQDGGCLRCQGPSSCGADLATCLCLHAEENALLESGRRSAVGATLYCTTAPCLQCSKKLLQCSVQRVVYAWEYSVEHDSRRVLTEAGVRLEKFAYPQRVYLLSHILAHDAPSSDVAHLQRAIADL